MAYGLTKSANFVRASSQYLNRATNLGIATNLTIEGWISPATQPGSGAAMTAFGVRGTTNNNLAAISYIDVAGTKNIQYELNADNVAGFTANFAATLANGSWNHVALTFDGTNVLCYLNGVQVTSFTSAIGGSSTNSFTIGTHPNIAGVTTQFWDGNVSLVRGWSSVLSAATILANICNVYGTATTNMVGEWSLDNVLTDASGNAFTLTNNAAATFTASVPSTCAVATTSYVSQLLTLNVG